MKKTKIYLALLLGFVGTSSALAQAPNQNDFEKCLKNLKPIAINQGISSENYEKYTKDLALDLKVLEKLEPKSQPEVSFSLTKYLGALVAARRVISGVTMFNQHSEALKEIEKKYGVPPQITVAVWGVESNYGRSLGKFPIVQSLGTLSCFGRRQEYFKKEWFASLKILQEGHFKQEQFNGSWAGAFGQTQFMPNTFMRVAVDFDGDGKKDLFNSSVDSLASTANFLKDAGWKPGMTWGYEVAIPDSLKESKLGRKDYKDVKYWAEKGVKLANGKPLPNDLPVTGIIVNSDLGSTSFLITKNFESIYRYNASEKYALAIGKLSEMIITFDPKTILGVGLNFLDENGEFPSIIIQ
jgi:lytic murein transglycosylase